MHPFINIAGNNAKIKLRKQNLSSTKLLLNELKQAYKDNSCQTGLRAFMNTTELSSGRLSKKKLKN